MPLECVEWMVGGHASLLPLPCPKTPRDLGKAASWSGLSRASPIALWSPSLRFSHDPPSWVGLRGRQAGKFWGLDKEELLDEGGCLDLEASTHLPSDPWIMVMA